MSTWNRIRIKPAKTKADPCAAVFCLRSVRFETYCMRMQKNRSKLPSSPCFVFANNKFFIGLGEGGKRITRSSRGRGTSRKETLSTERRYIGCAHRLNMELDLQSLFGLHVHSSTHWLRPRNSPHLAYIRGR